MEKRGVIKTLHAQAKSICSSEGYLKKEIETLSRVFQKMDTVIGTFLYLYYNKKIKEGY